MVTSYMKHELFFVLLFAFFVFFFVFVWCLSLSVALVYFVSTLDGTFIYGDVDHGEDYYDDNVDVEGNLCHLHGSGPFCC